MGETMQVRYNALKMVDWVVLLMVIMSLGGSILGCAGQQEQQNKQLATATREIGEAYMRQGNYTAALRELLKAESYNPEDHFVHNGLGLCYMQKKRMPDAIAHFKKAVSLKPSYTPARNNLGTAYLTLGEWDLAIATFEEITQDVLYATPQFPLANLGWAYYNKGDYRKAMSYYKQALKIDPNFVHALRGVGRTYLATNQGRLALRYLERAVKLAPQAPEIHFDLAEAYLLTGRYDQARFSYETVIDLAPQESELSVKAKRRLGAVR